MIFIYLHLISDSPIADICSKTPLHSFVNYTKKNWRSISAAILICFGISIGAWYLLQESIEEKLSGKTFCLISFRHNGKEIKTETIGLKFVFPGSCQENVIFHPGNDISLPGIKSYSAFGKWQISNDKIWIHSLKSYQELYEGEYKVNFEDNGDVLLKSSKNEIRIRYTPFPNPLRNIQR